MAGPTADEVGRWLIDNPDKEGTPDYVQMSNAYRNLRAPAAPAAPSGFVETFKSKIGLGPAEGITDPEQFKTATRLTSDPGNVGNTVGRVVTGAVGGIPDLAIGVANAGARMSGRPDSQIDYITPKLQELSGTAPMAADASLARQLLEGGASAVLGGGGAAGAAAVRAAPATAGVISRSVRAVTPTVLPMAGAYGGGEAGGYVGKELGDEETGRFLGSLVGGLGGAASPVLRAERHQRYAGQAAPNAPEIAAAAARQGVTPTAGMLGNDAVLLREQRLSGQPGGAHIIQNARNDARTQIGGAYDDAAARRGAVDPNPTPGTIGEKINRAAGESAEALRAASDARQAALFDRIGPETPVAVDPVRERGYDMMADPRARLTPTQRGAIDQRITDELPQLITRNAAGDPIRQPIGTGGAMSDTAPLGDFLGFRTELGKSIDRPGGVRSPPTAELYPPATEVIREAAARRGVNPLDFDTVQNQTRAVERTTPETPGGPIGDYPTLQRFVNQDPTTSYTRATAGFQDPNTLGTIEATGHQGVGEIMGDIIRQIGNETINNPQGGARGPAQLDTRYTRMHPEVRETLLGDEAGNVGDALQLSRALNIPTQQNGLTRAVGGQGDAVANKVIGSEALGQLGSHVAGPLGAILGRIIGVVGPGGLRNVAARVLEGPTVRNALSGGAAPSVLPEVATALQAAAQQPGAP